MNTKPAIMHLTLCEREELRRMTQDAQNHNFPWEADRIALASMQPELPLAEYDRLMADYRRWLWRVFDQLIAAAQIP